MTSDTKPPSICRIDQVCDAFEAVWKAGGRPDLVQFLAQAPEPERTQLFQALLDVELEYRFRRGEHPAAGEYLSRFPDRAEIIRALLPRSATVPAPPSEGLLLSVTEGPHRGQQFRFTGHETFLVGRSPLAHFQLSDKDRYFSRIHFMIEVNLPYCRLVDAGSRNGTYVNGRRVCSVDLHDSDHIRAGYTVLHVSLPTVAPHRKTSTAVPGTAPPPGTALFSPPGTLPWVPDAPDTSLPVVPGFEIVRPLGRGGMGTVYEAIHQADGSRVALKTIVPAVVENPSAVTRFLREAGILRELDHPHIVRFLDIGEANEVLFFAMEYVSGTDAARLLLQRGPLPLPTAIALTCQVLEALAYAHDRGFVHRDVKPANILIAECAGQSHVKLADFGLARVYQTSQLSGLTLSGAVGGTFGFMSPEQARSVRSARPQSDQYATAASLYNLLTGHFLYDFNQFEAFPLAVILTEDPVPIDRRRSDLPAGLVEAIHRATARDPADRFPDVQAFREALLPFAS